MPSSKPLSAHNVNLKGRFLEHKQRLECEKCRAKGTFLFEMSEGKPRLTCQASIDPKDGRRSKRCNKHVKGIRSLLAASSSGMDANTVLPVVASLEQAIAQGQANRDEDRLAAEDKPVSPVEPAAGSVMTSKDRYRVSISSKKRRRVGSDSESEERVTEEIDDNDEFGYYTEEDVCRIDEGEAVSEVLTTSDVESEDGIGYESVDESEDESEDEIGDENKDEDDNEDDSADEAPTQADLDKTRKQKDLERRFINNQYTEFMEEFNNDRSIIESGRTLTDGDIELVKESTNYRDEDCVAFTLLKDALPIWLAKHERFLGVTFYKKGGHQCREGGRVEYFKCGCSGNKEEKKNRHAGGRTGRVQTIRRETKKCGCKSRINFHHKTQSLPSHKVVEVVEVKYFYRHNHTFARNKVAHLPLSNAMKRLIRAEVENGARSRDIKAKLSQSYEQFAADRAQGLRPTRDDFLTHDDIQNAKHKVLLADVKKHDDRVISAQRWMDDIAREQGFSYHDENDGAYCFSSKWQMEKLLAYGDAICIDVSHEAFGKDTFLFTLVARKNPEGYGIPVAFCLSRSAKKVVLIDWIFRLLAHIKMYYHQDYSPNVVLMDQDTAEFDSIKAAFPSATILYCHFHVLKAVTGLIMRAKDSRRICLDEAGQPAERLRTANEEIQAQAVRDFITLLIGEEDLAKANRSIDEFKERWKDYAFIIPLGRYFTVDMKPRWMFAYRKNISYGRMNTNNLIESYQNQVKRHCLANSRRRYADMVIYTLYRQVLPSYELKCVTSDSGPASVSSGSRNTVERINVAKEFAAKEYAAKAITDKKYGRIKYEGDSTVKVRSFSKKTVNGRKVFYRMNIDYERGTISRCTCPTGFRRGIECHHVALVKMDLKHLEFDNQQGHVERNPGRVPPESPRRVASSAPKVFTLEDVNNLKEKLDKAVSDIGSLKLKDLQIAYSRLESTILMMKEDQKIEQEGSGEKANRVGRDRRKRHRHDK